MQMNNYLMASENPDWPKSFRAKGSLASCSGNQFVGNENIKY
jgi:hypothetical protein